MPALNRRKLSKEERRAKRKEYNDRHYAKRRGFIIREKEKRIHFNCRLPEQLIAIMTRLLHEGIATGKYPYQNMGDITTDLVKKGLGTLKEQDDQVRAIWPGLQVSHQLEQIQALRRQAQTIVNRLSEEISQFEAIGAHAESLQFFWSTMDEIKKMPPTVYRDWAIKKLQHDFPKLAKAQVPGVRLVKFKS